MLKRSLLIAAILLPQIASAADLPPKRYHAAARRSEHVAAQSGFIPCTTHHFFGLLTFGQCGGVFNPFEVSGL